MCDYDCHSPSGRTPRIPLHSTNATYDPDRSTPDSCFVWTIFHVNLLISNSTPPAITRVLGNTDFFQTRASSHIHNAPRPPLSLFYNIPAL